MFSLISQLLHMVFTTLVYWYTFWRFWWCHQPIDSFQLFGEWRLPVCHMYVLAKTLHLWDAPHYRAPTFADDLRANLKNVAIPGTGVPLSIFCASKATALLFIVLINPIACLLAAMYTSCTGQQPQTDSTPSTSSRNVHSSASTASSSRSFPPATNCIPALYRQLLLEPQHWFAIWRHNCLLVGYHALLTGSSSYRMEAKGTFLLEGRRLGLPVSPFYEDGAVFVKHVSVEGGMGIHVFRNFAQGGDWVIQRALSNSAELSRLLPPGAPLSTLRVVTASIAWLESQGIIDSTAVHWLQVNRQHADQQQPAAGAANAAGWHHRQQPSSRQPQARAGHADSLAAAAAAHGSSSSSSWQDSGRLTPPLPLSGGVVRPLSDDGGGSSSHVAAEAMTRSRANTRRSQTPLAQNCAPKDAGQGSSSPAARRSSAHQSGAAAGAVNGPISRQGAPAAASTPGSRSSLHGSTTAVDDSQQPQQPLPDSSDGDDADDADDDASSLFAGRVEVVTAVWRAGLAGKDTDHASICFALEPDTGLLGRGVSSNHWYRLGPRWLGRLDTAAGQVWLNHPDSGAAVSGAVLPGIGSVMRAVSHAHMVAAPDVPLVGWDVALTPEGMFLLEANLSCNLFNGPFDNEGFYEMMYHFFVRFDELEARQTHAWKYKSN